MEDTTEIFPVGSRAIIPARCGHGTVTATVVQSVDGHNYPHLRSVNVPPFTWTEYVSKMVPV